MSDLDNPSSPTSGQNRKIWQARIFRLALVLLIAFGLSFYQKYSQSITPGQHVAELKPQTTGNIINPTEAAQKQSLQEVILKPHPDVASKTDVYIKDPTTNHEDKIATIDHVYRDHYHPAVYAQGYLYIICRTEPTDPNKDSWTDELWQYHAQQQGVKLYEGRGLDFRLSPDTKTIAIIASQVAGREEFVVLNPVTKNSTIFSRQQLHLSENVDLQWGLLEWSSDSQFIWGALGSAGALEFVYRFNVKMQENTVFDVSQLNLQEEYDIHYEQGMVVYSTYPPMLAEEDAQEFEKTKEVVNLLVYDLATKQTRQIATSHAKPFHPQWIGVNRLEYQDPKNEQQRIAMTIEPFE